jgi:hypothetical protein
MSSWPAAPGINPRIYENWRIVPALRPLKQDVVGGVGDVLWVLMGTIGIVMLIASANVANLLLVRVDARQQELAIRAALGAGWRRIVRELLIESILLGITGGALGVALAHAGLQLLVAIGPANLPRLSEVSIDMRALGFALIVSLLSSTLFGLIPALKYAGPRISASLHSAGRTVSASRERHRTRNILVVVQVAMALVLLVSAGLMIRTFEALHNVAPGFTLPEHLQTLSNRDPWFSRSRTGTRRPSAEQHRRQAGGNSGRDIRGVHKPDAPARHLSRLGRCLLRGKKLGRRRDSFSPDFQVNLPRPLSNGRHKNGRGAGLHMD